MRARMRGLLLASVVVAASAVPAAAQTVEEAVAYLVSGLVDGATVGTSVFKRTAASPATYEAAREKPNEHEPKVTIVFTRKTDCIFDLSVTLDQGKGAKTSMATLDFGKVTAMDFVGKERVKVTGKDYCTGQFPPACGGRLAVDVQADKFKAAYADMRKSCH